MSTNLVKAACVDGKGGYGVMVANKSRRAEPEVRGRPRRKANPDAKLSLQWFSAAPLEPVRLATRRSGDVTMVAA